VADGYLINCSGCDFEFVSGHHYVEARSNAICTGCLARYVLLTRESWPQPGELVELNEHSIKYERRRGRRKHEPGYQPPYRIVQKPTGQMVTAVRSQPSGWSYESVEALGCTKCGKAGTIVLTFSEGGACPACQAGKLRAELVEF
jgi:hypothetical protein